MDLVYVNDPSNNDEKYSRVVVRNFIKKNPQYKKNIIQEFKLIRDNYNFYKKMIYQMLNLLIIDAGFKKLILNAKEFFNLHSELRNNILIKSMRYVNDSNFQIRSQKTVNLVKQISKFQHISLKSNKTSINRIDNKIIITKV